MSGYHGTVGATGVRPAVCPEPLRRALTVAGLVTGILFAVWLASAAPADAADLSVTEPVLSGGSATVPSPQTIGGSLGETVAHVGEHTSRTVDGASEAARAVGAEAAEPLQQVREVVRETPLPYTDQLPEVVAPVSERVSEPVTEQREHVTPAIGEAREAQGVAETEEPAVEHRTAPELLAEVRTTPDTSTQEAHSRTGADGVSSPGSEHVPAGPGNVANGTAPATGSSTATAPAVAGFLPVTGAPAPEPGLFEAARHVLRSAPADSADEPTFSPD